MSIFTKEAMLDYLSGRMRESYPHIAPENIKRIIVLLQQPIMPEQPDDALLRTLYSGNADESAYLYHWTSVRPKLEERYNALRAALLTPPKPKMKTVWFFSAKINGSHLLYDHPSEESAQANRERPLKSIADKDGIWTHVSPIWSQEVEDK